MPYITPTTYPSFGRSVRLYYEERNVNVSANTSDLYWELQGYNRINDSTGYYYAGPFTVTINGKVVANRIYPEGARIQLRNIETARDQYTSPNNGLVASGTLANIAHNTDGSKTVAVSFSCDYIGDSSNKAVCSNGSIPLTTIARKSTVTASDGVFGVNWAVNIKAASSTFTHTLTISIGDHNIERTDLTAGGISFSGQITRQWADAAPTSDSAVATITCTTFNGADELGTVTTTATFSVPTSWGPLPGVPPRAVPVGVFGEYGAIQHVSKASIHTIYTSQGSSIASISVYGPGINETRTNPQAHEEFVTGVLMESGTQTWQIVVTDARGRVTQSTASLEVTPYDLPTVNLTVHRCNADGSANDLGEYMKAVATCTFDTSLTNNKGYVYARIYQGSTATSLGELRNQTASPFELTTSPFAANSTQTYLVEADVEDEVLVGLGEPITVSARLSTAQVLFDCMVGGRGLSVGGSATRQDVFEVQNWAFMLSNHRRYPGVQFRATDQARVGGWLWLATKLINQLYAGDRLAFGQYSYDSSTGEQLTTYETYRLPSVEPNLTNSPVYNIVTDKAAEVGTWTPTISWSDGSTLTVSGISCEFQKWGKAIHYYGYFNITDLGQTGNKYLRITLPHTVLPGLNGAGPHLDTSGTQPARPFLLRLFSTYMQAVYGPGAGYTRPNMTTGWYSFDFWAMEA